MKLTDLPGIGPKTEEAFKKAGIEDAAGLLMCFPGDFEVFKEPCTISGTGYKTFAAVKGAFADIPFTRTSNGKKITAAVFKDEAGGSMRVTWFNAPYIQKAVSPGRLYVLRGRVSRKYNVVSMSQPKVYSPDEYESKTGRMLPVYPQIKGVARGNMIKYISAAMNSEAFGEIAAGDIIPEKIREKYDLMPIAAAVKNMHFPETQQDYARALRRVCFEEIFLFILSMRRRGVSEKKESGVIIKSSPETDEFISKLPFELTDSQKEVISEIRSDLASGFSMNRLLQGDVGSGKTITALCALMDAAYSGYQGVLMAPTEILAKQHAQTIEDLFKSSGTDIKTALLTGSMSALEKKAAYDAIEDGRVQIIIGTHALFQEKVRYKNLGLVITDEQHRFGTAQRKALAEKGTRPHMLVMSATPIPRTLALILYGGMDVSTISQVPKNRLPVKNAVVDESFRPNAYRFIEKEVRKGRQAYIICPLIEYSEGLEANNVADYTEMLRDIFPEDISVGMLHGRMDPAQKDDVMEKFAQGKIRVLVSTTVVEVGVDVPNATVMMVEDADRFGLAQLHQLRGRVGRGKEQSYCIFVSDSASKQAKERLEVLYYSNDGFEIAKKDLELRGPGEFFGSRQSGAFSFKYFDVSRDMNIALAALRAAEDIADGRVLITEDEKRRLDEQTGSAGDNIIL